MFNSLSTAMGAALVPLIILFFLMIVYVVRSQVRQHRALDQIEESLRLSRRNVENVERLLDLTERSVGQQEEMIRLLRRLADPGSRQSEATGAFQPPASAIP